ncbi:MAG: ribonuclease III [Alicyclobacillus sp.]|nr:ribonuclease III [Alicyclobacillus sp.]
MTDPDLTQLERALGFEFDDKSLLEQAFVHRSYLNENPGFNLQSNERLEFLGDSVLGYLVAEHLFELLPNVPEGTLTSLRAAVVRAETLARAAKRLELGNYLFLGRGEEASGGRSRPINLARAFEALVGAILLDQGLDTCRRFILASLQEDLARVVREKSGKDFKSRLQELTQGRWQLTPTYRTIAAVGPDHAKTFTVEVVLDGHAIASGTGRNKQAAEQEAAKQAYEQLVERGELPWK